jgi:hypothetical protein
MIGSHKERLVNREQEIASLNESLGNPEQAVKDQLQTQIDAERIGQKCHKDLEKLLETNKLCRWYALEDWRSRWDHIRRLFEPDLRNSYLTPWMRRLISRFIQEHSKRFDFAAWLDDWGKPCTDLYQWREDFQQRKFTPSIPQDEQ